jgi:uncharacterized RDD family membrane protein YckC
MSQLENRKLSNVIFLTHSSKEHLKSAEPSPNYNSTFRHADGLHGTAAERILNESVLQQHWTKRAIAILIDSLIVGIITAILEFLTDVTGIFNWMSLPFMMGLIYVLYFAVMESIYGYTMGKKIVNLKVTRTNGKKPSLRNAFIRNISKIHFLILLLDTLAGFFTSKDNHQRYIDQIANTTVV